MKRTENLDPKTFPRNRKRKNGGNVKTVGQVGMQPFAIALMGAGALIVNETV